MNGKNRIFTIVPSAAYTTSGSIPLNSIPGDWDEIVGYLDVTAASGTSPTLNVSFDTTVDGGTRYYTHTAFTAATTTTSERKVFPAPCGIDGRISYTIGGTTPSFTFTVRLECKRNS